jgi:hypothetical protein
LKSVKIVFIAAASPQLSPYSSAIVNWVGGESARTKNNLNFAEKYR